MLRDGKMDDRFVDIEMTQAVMPMIEVLTPQGMEGMEFNLKEMFSNLMPKKTKKKTVKIPEALEILTQEEASKLVDMDKVTGEAVRRVEQSGIVFLDEIDKIAGRESAGGPDVSRQGVQRDLLPIVEGSTVNTKYGMVKTDHILFIASGAFHIAKPSDLIPEFQGRFPIRVELSSLTQEDFVRILTEPKNALIKQYEALLETEGVTLTIRRRRDRRDRPHRFRRQRAHREYRRAPAAHDSGAPARRRFFCGARDARPRGGHRRPLRAGAARADLEERRPVALYPLI